MPGKVAPGRLENTTIGLAMTKVPLVAKSLAYKTTCESLALSGLCWIFGRLFREANHVLDNAVSDLVGIALALLLRFNPLHPAGDRCPNAFGTAQTGVAGPTAAQNHQSQATGRRRFCSEDLENASVDFQALAPFDPLESAKSG
jgi:hypothetical protein